MCTWKTGAWALNCLCIWKKRCNSWMWNCNEKGFVFSNKSLPTTTELFYDGGRYHIETSPLICRFLYDNGLCLEIVKHRERVFKGMATSTAALSGEERSLFLINDLQSQLYTYRKAIKEWRSSSKTSISELVWLIYGKNE